MGTTERKETFYFLLIHESKAEIKTVKTENDLLSVQSWVKKKTVVCFESMFAHIAFSSDKQRWMKHGRNNGDETVKKKK